MNEEKFVKCVVWDLDDTLWSGTLLEGDAVVPDPKIVEAIKEFDRRGILNSIASRNDAATALAKLEELAIAEYFLFPQIDWGAKHASVARIASDLSIGTDTIAFIEDQAFERDEVAHSLPGVRCYPPDEVPRLLGLPEFTPPFVSEESARRRSMYVAEADRSKAESQFRGPKEEFLAGLKMTMIITPAGAEDLRRAEELTVRTNQLNTTGRTYSYEELDGFRGSPDHLLLMATLEDRYGSYGKVGLALVELGEDTWTLKLLLMSCRVMSRGVGSVMLNHVMWLARESGRRLIAELVPNDVNRMMLITLRFSGFEEVGRDGDVTLLESRRAEIPAAPAYLSLVIEGDGVSLASSPSPARPSVSAD